MSPIEKAREWHKRFIPGITPMLVYVIAAGLVSSVFFIRGQYDSILQGQKDDRKHTDSLVTIIAVRQDNRISALQDTFKNQLQSLKNEMNYRFELESVRHNNSRMTMVTEKWVNGQLKISPVK